MQKMIATQKPTLKMATMVIIAQKLQANPKRPTTTRMGIAVVPKTRKSLVQSQRIVMLARMTRTQPMLLLAVRWMRSLKRLPQPPTLLLPQPHHEMI